MASEKETLLLGLSSTAIQPIMCITPDDIDADDLGRASVERWNTFL
jgi:hypothetical protein